MNMIANTSAGAFFGSQLIKSTLLANYNKRLDVGPPPTPGDKEDCIVTTGYGAYQHTELAASWNVDVNLIHLAEALFEADHVLAQGFSVNVWGAIRPATRTKHLTEAFLLNVIDNFFMPRLTAGTIQHAVVFRIRENMWLRTLGNFIPEAEWESLNRKAENAGKDESQSDETRVATFTAGYFASHFANPASFSIYTGLKTFIGYKDFPSAPELYEIYYKVLANAPLEKTGFAIADAQHARVPEFA